MTPEPGTTPTPGPDQPTVTVPRARFGWGILGGAGRRRVLHQLVDAHGLDGYAALGMVVHACSHVESPYAADVEAAITAVMNEIMRETVTAIVEGMRPITEGYVQAVRSLARQLGPMMADTGRPRHPGGKGERGRVPGRRR